MYFIYVYLVSEIPYSLSLKIAEVYRCQCHDDTEYRREVWLVFYRSALSQSAMQDVPWLVSRDEARSRAVTRVGVVDSS